MFRLSREVRFTINRDHYSHEHPDAVNGYAGSPAMTELGRYFALQMTLSGDLDEDSQYLVNIKKMDAVVRDRAISTVAAYALKAEPTSPARLIAYLFERLQWGWHDLKLEDVRLLLSPLTSVSCLATEHPMTRLSQKFEFSASHRLHNPALSDDVNRSTYGKCNNPNGHGHNYEVQVTLAGSPADDTGMIVDVPVFEWTVATTVIDRLDHKNLNVEVPEFRDLIPSVENIARVIYRMLKPKLEAGRTRLASVTVWETPKTWCEYSE